MNKGKYLRAAAEYASAFTVGGVMYGAIETLFRGYTHPSMLVTGGICFAALYALDKYGGLALPLRALVGALMITAAEFAAGCICNLWLGWDVWDYSHFRTNLLGQICLPFTLLWVLISIPAFGVASLLRRAVGAEKRGRRRKRQLSASGVPSSDSPSSP